MGLSAVGKEGGFKTKKKWGKRVWVGQEARIILRGGLCKNVSYPGEQVRRKKRESKFPGGLGKKKKSRGTAKCRGVVAGKGCGWSSQSGRRKLHGPPGINVWLGGETKLLTGNPYNRLT